MSTLVLAKRRALRRRSSAGGTMFVVAMTLAVLSAIGAWALQSAALEVRMAGYERQSTQTHYLAEYGVMAAMQDVTPTTLPIIAPAALCGVTSAGAIVHAACSSVPCLNYSATPVTVMTGTGCGELTSVYNVAKTCYRWDTALSGGFPVSDQTSSTPLLDVGDGGVGGLPGSLGATNTQGNFAAEFTDLMNAPQVAGFSTGGGMSTYWATVTAYGQTSTSAGITSQGTEQLRSRLQVGPIPTINLGSCQ